MAASYIVQEADGTSKFTLEDSSGAVLLEISSGGGGSGTFTNLLLTGVGVLTIYTFLLLAAVL